MDSQETPAASSSSSRGTAIPPEVTTGARGHGNLVEDIFDIASEELTRGFQLQIFPEIDPAGDYNVPIVAPEDDLPRPPAPLAPLLDQASVLVNEIVNLFYDAEFQRLRRVHTCDYADDCLEEYNNSDDDDDDDDHGDVKDGMVGEELVIAAHDQVDGSSEEVVEEVPDQLTMLQQSGIPGTITKYVATCAPLNVPQPKNTEIAVTARTAWIDDISSPQMAVSSMERIDEIRSRERAAVEIVDGERAGVVRANILEQVSPPQKRLAVENSKVDPTDSLNQGSSSSSDCSGDCSTSHTN